MNKKNGIQDYQIDEATRNLEDLTFRIERTSKILEQMKSDTCKVINKRFWDKYFLVIPEQTADSIEYNYTRKPYHEFTLSPTQYSFEKGYQIQIGRTSHPTKYDGTPNDTGRAYGDWYKVIVPSSNRLEIIEALQDELTRLTLWSDEKRAEIARMGLVDEAQLIADIIAVYEKHGGPARIWDKMLESRELSSYNLTHK